MKSDKPVGENDRKLLVPVKSLLVSFKVGMMAVMALLSNENVSVFGFVREAVVCKQTV